MQTWISKVKWKLLIAADFLGLGETLLFLRTKSLSSVNFLVQSPPLEINLMAILSCPERWWGHAWRGELGASLQ